MSATAIIAIVIVALILLMLLLTVRGRAAERRWRARQPVGASDNIPGPEEPDENGESANGRKRIQREERVKRYAVEARIQEELAVQREREPEDR